ncbi:odorant receptor 10-like [Megachile rotundata]|uniref:odorant receptor 10-like n=1 Tax=Megachile rotundata TaxID=143995 RepID=UPI003FD17750
MLSATLDSMKQGYFDNGTSNRHLPYDVWHGMTYLKSPEFEIIYAGQIMASFACCCAVCGMDGMLLTTILHLSGQFRLITTWLTNIGIEMNYTTIDLSKRPVKIVAGLMKCIRHHQRLIKTVKDVNIFITPIVFVHLLTSGMQICLTGFAVLSNNVGANVFKFISYLGAVMIQLVMLCWPGEILIQESQKVAYAAYLNVPWYQLPLCYRRHLLFVIMKAQESCCIKALTFESLSSHTLTSVFNTAASYFTLLRQMQETPM